MAPPKPTPAQSTTEQKIAIQTALLDQLNGTLANTTDSAERTTITASRDRVVATLAKLTKPTGLSATAPDFQPPSLIMSLTTMPLPSNSNSSSSDPMLNSSAADDFDSRLDAANFRLTELENFIATHPTLTLRKQKRVNQVSYGNLQERVRIIGNRISNQGANFEELAAWEQLSGHLKALTGSSIWSLLSNDTKLERNPLF